MTHKLSPFSPDYIQQCFHMWYSAGRPDMAILVKSLPEDTITHRTVSASNLKKWRKDYEWDFKADELDNKAITLIQDDMVQKKADMLLRQAEIGFKLQELGMKYLEDMKFDSSASAVQAIKVGSELERSSRGISELVLKLSKMTDDELEQEIINQLSRGSEAGQIVEGEEITGDVDASDSH